MLDDHKNLLETYKISKTNSNDLPYTVIGNSYFQFLVHSYKPENPIFNKL